MRFLKNLRPITLLENDYKIIEKVIAMRLEEILDDIIHRDQQGFMKNRHISVNIRRIFDLMKYSEEKELETFVLSLDFAKCFDKIEFESMIGAMDYFGVSSYLKEWIRILYTGFKVRIQNNGYFSKPIVIGRGLHQGGPASSLIFLICAEILAIQLRKNETVKGIPVREIQNLLGQYADDMDIYMVKNQEALNVVFDILEWFRL